MDFKKFCNGIDKIACVVSVQKLENGYGEIRLVDGNEKYYDTYRVPQPGSPKVTVEFIPNSIYTKYIDKNTNFEEYCYQSAINKKLLHSYAYPKGFSAWFHMLYIPIDYETKDLGYCLYIMEVDKVFDSNILSSANNDVANNVLKTTLQLSNSIDFKVSLKQVLKDIRLMCKATFGCILLIDESKKELTVLAEDKDDNSDRKNMEYYMDDEFYSLVESWYDTIGDSNCLVLNDSNFDFIKEKNPKWYDSLKKSTVKSLVIFPLKTRKKLLGYIWVNNYEEDSIKIKETLEITTFILESEISNYLLINKFKELSTMDQLTGVFNRNEMNYYVDKLIKSDKDLPIGVIFLDVNGLKKVNDTDGHLAGDDLIRRASGVLKAVTKRSKIFRAGGDEFTIIVEDASIQLFEEFTERIRKKAKENNVSFAIGYSIKDRFNKILSALKEADEKMYNDKRIYYESLK